MELEGNDSRKRNMDRRRETSRCAARDRRGKEADIFADLKDVVPIVEDATVAHLDRIALLRVAATVCRFRKSAGKVLTPADDDGANDNSETGVWNEDTITECLDGFLLIVDSDGTVMYITESVSIYLGLTQTDMTGRSIRDFLDSADYDEFVHLVSNLSATASKSSNPSGRTVIFRMKTVISPRGRNLNMKSALYKPISFLVHCRKATSGHVMVMQGIAVPAGQGSVNATATALTKSSETQLGVYMTRHTCDMRISYISDRFNYILKSDLKTLLGCSFYELVHPADCDIVCASIKELFTKGHTRTLYYRLMGANRSLVWVMTEASTISHTTKGQKGQYIICVHYVLGVQAESESLVMCSDVSPAGLPIYVKKEVDDIRDYVGLQPEVIENDNYVPLFADSQYDVSESIRSPSVANSSEGRKNSFDEVLHWLFRDNSDSPTEVEKQPESFGSLVDPVMAPRQFVPASNSPACQDRPIKGTEQRARSAAHASFSPSVRVELRSPALAAPSLPIRQYGPMASGPATGVAPRVSPIYAADAHSVSIVGGPRSTGVFSPLPPAYPSTAATAPSQQKDVSPPLYTQQPIVEDLQWEEPDLTGLAPFVPDDDEIQFGGMDSMPKDLQLMFSDMPEWTAAQPLIPVGQRQMMTDQKRQHQNQIPVQSNRYEPVNADVKPSIMQMSSVMNQQRPNDVMFSAPAHYWQQQSNMQSPSDNLVSSWNYSMHT